MNFYLLFVLYCKLFAFATTLYFIANLHLHRTIASYRTDAFFKLLQVSTITFFSFFSCFVCCFCYIKVKVFEILYKYFVFFKHLNIDVLNIMFFFLFIELVLITKIIPSLKDFFFVFSNRKQGNKYLQNILLTPHYFQKTHRIAMQLSMGDFK